MIKLPNKDKCKRREFNRALKVGMYVTMDFLDHKNTMPNWYWDMENHFRDMTPRPKIFKVVEKNKLNLVYYYSKKEDRWINTEEPKQRDWDFDKVDPYQMSKKHFFDAHNIWAWFQRDEVRNIVVMNKEELLEKYLTELI